MKAKKNRRKFDPEDLGVDVTPRLRVLKVAEPQKRDGGEIVETIDDLVDKLKTSKGNIVRLASPCRTRQCRN